MVMSGRGRPIGTLSSSGSSNERNVRVHRRWEMYQTQGTQELMAPAQPFSKRHGFRGDPKEITVREDAPEPLRYFVVQTAIDSGLSPSFLRRLLCRVLRTTPDPSNWSEYPNIWDEIQSLIRGCDWFKVYDFVEALQANFAQRYDNSFADAVNEFFVDEGIGWQLVDGQILTRGPEAFETIVTEATAALETSKRPTAAGHLHEALQDLSRRPEADLPGAAYHAMGALECVARDLTGDPKATPRRNPEAPPWPAPKAAGYRPVAGLGVRFQ